MPGSLEFMRASLRGSYSFSRIGSFLAISLPRVGEGLPLASGIAPRKKTSVSLILPCLHAWCFNSTITMNTELAVKGLPSLNTRILSIALPIMVQSLVQYALVFTDTAFIGHYQEEGLSAISNTIAPYFMLQSFFFALSQGATILIAQNIGAGRPDKSGRYAEVSLFVHVLVSFLYLLFWQSMGSTVVYLMGARGVVAELATSYIETMAFNYLFLGVGMTLAAVFEGVGKTYPIMVAAIVRCLLNVVLDWIMIFGNFGFPEMGIRGAALATVISEGVGMAVGLLYFLKLKLLPISFKGIFTPSWKFYREVLRVGLPVGLEYSLWTAGQVGIIAMLNRISALAAGHFSVLNLIMEFSVNIYIGIGIAAMNLVGTATGARDPVFARQAAQRAILISQGICVAVAILYISLPEFIVGVFITDPGSAAGLTPIIWVLALTIFPKALNVVAGSSIRGTGDTRWMFYTQIAGTIMVLAAAAFFLFGLEWGIRGMMFAVLADEGLRAIINYLRFHRSSKRAILAGGTQVLPLASGMIDDPRAAEAGVLAVPLPDLHPQGLPDEETGTASSLGEGEGSADPLS